jgi:hypothetical protein
MIPAMIIPPHPQVHYKSDVTIEVIIFQSLVIISAEQYQRNTQLSL